MFIDNLPFPRTWNASCQVRCWPPRWWPLFPTRRRHWTCARDSIGGEEWHHTSLHIHTEIHTYRQTYIATYLQTYMCTCMHAYMHIHIYIYRCTYLYVDIYIYIIFQLYVCRFCTHVCIELFPCLFIQTCVHICTYTGHVYTHMYALCKCIYAYLCCSCTCE